MIRLHKPTLKRKDMDSVLSVMVNEAIAPGEKYSEFSLLLKNYFSAEGCVLYRSYPTALEAACEALHIGKETKVIISPLSPSWYADVLLSLEAEVLFADVDQYTGCISPEAVKELLQEGPEVLLVHNPFGNLPDYEKLAQLPIPIIEDITQSFGSIKNGEKPGSSASIIISAFEEDSVITTGGGAAVMVNDKKYSKPLQDHLGKTRNLELMSDMNAALGVSQFKALEVLLERRREYLTLFRSALSKTRHKLLTEENDTVITNGHTFPVLLDSRVQEVIKFTKRYKIETCRPFEECAVTRYPEVQEQLTKSIPFRMRTILFPLYPMLTQDQLKTLVRVLSTLP
jgi:perosamine synthetase